MKNFYLLIFLFFTLSSKLLQADKGTVHFTENRSQWPEPVLYKADVQDGALYLTSNAFVYNFIQQEDVLEAYHQMEKGKQHPVHAHNIRMNFFEGRLDDFPGSKARN